MWFRRHADFSIILLLIALWLLFFWRVFTPSTIDQVSLQEGDFSGQFVSWTSYAVERAGDGELPLWNPYMNAGAPFLADPQTAVFYPPHLATIGLLALGGEPDNGTVYAALQIEMTLHVLLALLFMYALLRVMTQDAQSWLSRAASFSGAVAFGFGGYVNAYPQLQLPVLETAVWAPLVILGIHVATSSITEIGIRWRWLWFAGVALAISVLAGHPQTFVLVGYTAVAYLIYRLWGVGWQKKLTSLVVFGMITAGLSAIQLLPTLDFQRSTYRQGFSFDDKSNGFAMQDILQVIFPDLLGQWSPLYIGIMGVLLVGLALWKGGRDSWFWGGVGLFALLLSVGRNLALYSVLYVLVPGFSLFRGQERAAIIITLVGCILAARGMVVVFSTNWNPTEIRWVRRTMLILLIACAVFALVFFFLRLQPPDGEIFQNAVDVSVTALLFVGIAFILMQGAMQATDRRLLYAVLLAGLLLFDLFSVNINNENFEPIPSTERLPEPAHIDVMQTHLAPGQHAEALRGVRRSYGALYRVPDIWGDSPLRLDGVEYILWNTPIERRWELFGVQVVNSEFEELPVPHQAVGTGTDEIGTFIVHQLLEPRPFALMVYRADRMTQEETRAALANPEFDLRETLILGENESLVERVTTGESSTAVTLFEPEYIEIQVETTTPGYLSLALPYHNGWQAEVSGEEQPVLKAYDGLSAVFVPAGTHTVILRYQPLALTLGAVISGFTLLALLGSLWVFRPQKGTTA